MSSIRVKVMSVHGVAHIAVVNYIAVIVFIRRLSLTQTINLAWPQSQNCSLIVAEGRGRLRDW